MLLLNPSQVLQDAAYVQTVRDDTTGFEFALVFSDAQLEQQRARLQAMTDQENRYLAPLLARADDEREHDTALWAAITTALGSAIRKAVDATQQALTAVKMDEGEAWVALDTHEERKPEPHASLADLRKWRTQKTLLEEELRLMTGRVQAAHTAYNTAAADALHVLQAQVEQAHEAAQQQVELAALEAALLRSKAQQLERTAAGRQQAVGRLAGRICSEGIHLFEDQAL